MSYKELNLNPKGLKTSDCVIRALALGLNRSWLDTFDLLCKTARKLKVSPTSKECYEKILEDYPTMDIFYFNDKGEKKRLKVKDVSFSGVCICTLANHLVTIKDGNYYDIFDCGNKCLYKCWKVEKCD